MGPKECREAPIVLGTRYNSWTIIGLAPPIRRHRAALCRCDCGAEQEVLFADLYRNRSTRCARCAGGGRRRVYFATEGDRYGSKTIIREDGYHGPHRCVLVKCDCGAEQRFEFAKVRRGIVNKKCCTNKDARWWLLGSED